MDRKIAGSSESNMWKPFSSFEILETMEDFYFKKKDLGNSLAVKSSGLHAFTAEGAGSIPGWETRIPQATQCGQKEKNIKKEKSLG